MTLATKYQEHPAFIEVSAAASAALEEIAEAYGINLQKYEIAAGNVVDDMTRLILIALEQAKGA